MLTERIEELHAPVLEYKRVCWEGTGKPAEHNAGQIIRIDGDTRTTGVLLLDQVFYPAAIIGSALGLGDDGPPTHLMVDAMCQMASEHMLDGEPIRAVVFSSDTHFRDGETYSEAEKRKRGDLARDYANNPASDVKEAMLTMVAERSVVNTVEWASIITPYHLDDGGVLVFDREAERRTSYEDAPGIQDAIFDTIVAAIQKGIDS